MPSNNQSDLWNDSEKRPTLLARIGKLPPGMNAIVLQGLPSQWKIHATGFVFIELTEGVQSFRTQFLPEQSPNPTSMVCLLPNQAVSFTMKPISKIRMLFIEEKKLLGLISHLDLQKMERWFLPACIGRVDAEPWRKIFNPCPDLDVESQLRLGIAAWIKSKSPPLPVNPYWAEGLIPLCEKITERACEPLNMAEISKISGWAISTLEHVFHASFCVSPIEYRNLARTSRIAETLFQGAKTLKSNYGFLHQSHLGQWFKRTYLEPPGRFQQMAMNSF